MWLCITIEPMLYFFCIPCGSQHCAKLLVVAFMLAVMIKAKKKRKKSSENSKERWCCLYRFNNVLGGEVDTLCK